MSVASSAGLLAILGGAHDEQPMLEQNDAQSVSCMGVP